MGQMTIGVKYGGYQGKDTLYVVEGRRCSEGTVFLLLDWIGIAFNSVSHAETKKALETLLDNYSQVFQPGLGTMTQVKALRPDARQRFCRPRPVPFAIRDKVGQELDKLEELGSINILFPSHLT